MLPLLILGLIRLLTTQQPSHFTNSIGIEMLLVPAGTFQMGSEHGDYDEQPTHRVTISHPFYMSETEITSDQFRHFRMDYEDAGPFPGYATGVSWQEATAFCEWLSKKEQRPYRLPTEAEWEYAARAGSHGPFSNGGNPLAHNVPNAFGLKNMESEAPEWVFDWYGPYDIQPQTDPVGPASGWTRVVRGGGIMMPYDHGPSGFVPYYRRDGNRAGMIPDFHGRHPIGFRIVQADLPSTVPTPRHSRLWQQFVKDTRSVAKEGPDPQKPWFRQRPLLPIPPEDENPDVIAASGIAPGVLGHNHSPGIAVMPNGDVLVIEFSAQSTSTEYLPNTTFIALRRRFGSEEWDMPELFYDFADVNDQSPLLWNDNGTVWFFGGGVGLDAVPFRYQRSQDSGVTWTRPEFPLLRGPIGGLTPQPITSAFRGPDGRIYVATDAVGGESMLWASDDGGRTWVDTGGRTDGRHTTFVVLKDGSILGMGGKNTNIDGYMPESISRDCGRTWTYRKSPFPALGSNQRPFIMRLASGRLFFASDWQDRRGKQPPGITQHGAFVALSNDEGATWHIKTIPGTLPHEAHVLPPRPGWAKDYHGYGTLGYAVAAQGTNGLIHLITSMNHPAQEFEMNEAWILSDAVQSGERQERDSAPQPAVHLEHYPNGKTKAEWHSLVGPFGKYLLDGLETWYYPDGKKEYEVTWRKGIKVGYEAYWDPDGQLLWEWDYQPGKVSTWIQYWTNGKREHLSHWRDGACEGEAVAYDQSGNVIAKYQFHNGDLRQ